MDDRGIEEVVAQLHRQGPNPIRGLPPEPAFMFDTEPGAEGATEPSGQGMQEGTDVFGVGTDGGHGHVDVEVSVSHRRQVIERR
jgi:hypothetical protein